MANRNDDGFEPDPLIGLLDLETLAAEARADADAVRRAGPEAILAARDGWDLRDDDVASTRHMDDATLEEAVVNDLLVLHAFEIEGHAFDFDAVTLVRFLGPSEAERARRALASPHVMSFLATRIDGQLRIAPEHMQDACDFAGFWPEGMAPLDATMVYSADPRQDPRRRLTPCPWRSAPGWHRRWRGTSAPPRR